MLEGYFILHEERGSDGGLKAIEDEHYRETCEI
jgi:hypothetical protein